MGAWHGLENLQSLGGALEPLEEQLVAFPAKTDQGEEESMPRTVSSECHR